VEEVNPLLELAQDVLGSSRYGLTRTQLRQRMEKELGHPLERGWDAEIQLRTRRDGKVTLGDDDEPEPREPQWERGRELPMPPRGRDQADRKPAPPRPGPGAKQPGAGAKQPGAGAQQPGAGAKKEPGAGAKQQQGAAREPAPSQAAPAPGKDSDSCPGGLGQALLQAGTKGMK
jgi:hypothetical protein